MIVRVHVEGNSNCNGNFKSVNCPFLVIYLLACTLVIVIKLIIVIEIVIITCSHYGTVIVALF